jgi:uncharacterized membrane protein (DUF2068 family)
MIVIALYLFLVSATVGIGVASKHFPPLYGLVSVMMLVGSFGLLRQLRFGWAFALGSAVLLVATWVWNVVQSHSSQGLVMVFLNLLIFMYLARQDVRERLR